MSKKETKKENKAYTEFKALVEAYKESPKYESKKAELEEKLESLK